MSPYDDNWMSQLLEELAAEIRANDPKTSNAHEEATRRLLGWNQVQQLKNEEKE